MRRYTIFFLVLICLQLSLGAQDRPDYATPDEGFELMRDLASAGNYPDARQIGYELLEENEANHDVSLYLARIYGWEKSYDTAYAIVFKVMSAEPRLYEAYEVCVSLAYWEGNVEMLETCAAGAAEIEPDSAGVYDHYLEALKEGDPEQKHPEIFGLYSYDHFSVPYVRNWHMLTVGGEIPFKHGTLIPSVNGGYHAGGNKPATDLQLNLDAYLILGKKTYTLLGYGFSPEGVLDYFPGHRMAAELWQSLPKGFSISAGLRYFYWEQHFPFLTFSAEKYAGNYWFAFRNYLFFKDYGVSGSYYLSARRYFATKFDHLTLTLGYGTAPDEPILVVSDLERLNAISGRIEYSKRLSPVVRITAMAGYAWEEYMDQESRHRIDMRVGFYYMIGK